MPAKPIEGSPPVPSTTVTSEKPKPVAPLLEESGKEPEKKTPKSPKPKERVVFTGRADKTPPETQEGKETFRTALNALAEEMYGKSSYKELPLGEKLTALERYIQDSEEISAPTRDTIQNLKEIIASDPNPDQLDRVKKEFAKLPQTEDFYGLEADIQRVLKEDAVRYVADRQKEYGINKYGVNDFAREIGERSVGGMIVPDRFEIYDAGSLPTNIPLKDYLDGIQKKIDVYGFTQDSEASIDQEAKLLDEIQKELVNRASGEDQSFRDEAQQTARRIRARINGLVEEKMSKRSGAELENVIPTNALDLMKRIEKESSLRYIKAKDVKKAYDRLPPNSPERDEFTLLLKRQIREKLAVLEESTEPWELRQSLDPTIHDLNQWLLITREIDHDAYHDIHTEAEARQWLHNLYRTMMKGASPTETKALLASMQDYDSMELYNALLHTPGVAEAFRLWESKADDLIAAETDPNKRKSIIEGIVAQLRADNKWDPDKTGISVETAVMLAERHYKESGRDAMKYREHIRKNKLIQIRNENGVLKYYVDPHAPLLWDPYRLLYCPEAMWGFFQFGADMGGTVKKNVIFNGKKYKEITFAQGVGADVLKSLLDNNFDLRLTDFYSRRKGYIMNAWIDKQLEQPGQGVPSEDSDIWFNRYSRNNSNEIELNTVLRNCIELKYKVDYAEKNGLPIWGGADAGTMKTDVERLRTAFPDKRALIDRAYADFVAALRQKETLNRTPGMEGDFFLDISGLKFEDMEWNRMSRLHEMVRGNFRDHFAGLEVFSQIGNFINNPSFENLSKLDPGAMKAYTFASDGQEYFMVPAYLAFCDVQRGKGPLGGEVIGLVDTWKSKYAKTYDVKSLTELDLYKIGRQLVTQGKMTRDAMYKIRQGFAGKLRDKLLENADPLSLMVLFMAIAKEMSDQVKKDLEKG
jgi:hypothetical protein